MPWQKRPGRLFNLNIMHERTRALLAALIVFAAIAPAGTAIAQEDDDSSIFGPIEISPLEFVYNTIRGETDSLGLWYDERFKEPPDVDDQAEDLRSFLNDHDQELVVHGNDVVDEHDVAVRNGTYVLEVTVVDDKDDPSEESTFYVLAEGDGSDVTGLEAVTSTNQTVDRASTLSAHQAKELNADLEDYYDNYVEEDEVPSAGFYVRKASKYTTISEIRKKEWRS